MSMPGPGYGCFRVAMYSGLFVEHDAISDSVAHKLDIFDRWRSAGVDVEVTVFTHYSTSDRPEVCRVADSGRVLCDARFREADVHVFEFGIYYDLFNLIHVIPPHAASAVVYHNITPRELVAPDNRAAVERSLAQLENVALADEVVCVSEFNVVTLAERDIAVQSVSVLGLPPALDLRSEPGRRSGPCRFLFLGRLVEAKGLLDLLAAIKALEPSDLASCRFVIAGSAQFSESAIVEAVRDAARWLPIEVVLDPDKAELSGCLLSADVLVMPSHHEGYCVPILEAFGAGCQVVASDAGNLPYIVGDLGVIYPCGDVGALGGLIVEHIARVRSGSRDRVALTQTGPVPADAWRDASARHVSAFSAAVYEKGFTHVMSRLLGAASLRRGAA
jgi:glycosyltransferase involved in cell wall biosynthesis